MAKEILELIVDGEHQKLIRTNKNGKNQVRINGSIEYFQPKIIKKTYEEKYKGKEVKLEYR